MKLPNHRKSLKLKYLPKYLSKSMNYFKLRNEFVLIYTMGKVGSSTVYHTLMNEYPLNHIYHVHYLSEYYLSDVLPKTSHSVQIEIGRSILDILKSKPKKRKKIITIVREPVSMMMSHLFEVPQDHLGTMDFADQDFKTIKKAFDSINFDYCFDWYDLEFKKFTGIDVYKYPFDKEKGYSIQHTSDYDVLFLKLEAFESALPRALNEFLGINVKSMINSNLTGRKTKGMLQDELKSNWNTDIENLQKIYSNKYCLHFYSDDEIQRFKEKWSSKIEA